LLYWLQPPLINCKFVSFFSSLLSAASIATSNSSWAISFRLQTDLVVFEPAPALIKATILTVSAFLNATSSQFWHQDYPCNAFLLFQTTIWAPLCLSVLVTFKVLIFFLSADAAYPCLLPARFISFDWLDIHI
jgi:hypothetical protein